MTRRIVQHANAKSLSHVYDLAASSLPQSHSSLLQQRALKSSSPMATASAAARVHDPPPRLCAAV